MNVVRQIIKGLRSNTPCGRYSILLTESAWDQINTECSKVESEETGGILVGYYADNASTAVITEAFPPPPDSSHTFSQFYRGVVGLRSLLKLRWLDENRSYYVGEWHYHPAQIIEPSRSDLSQMNRISRDDRYMCREPIMIIAGQTNTNGVRPQKTFVFPRGEDHIQFIPFTKEDSDSC